VAALKGGYSPESLQERLPRVDTVPFESEHNYMATLHSAGRGRPGLVYVKGALEVLLDRCAAALAGGGEETGLEKTRILAMAEEMAGRGLRVLAFAGANCPPAGTPWVMRTWLPA